MIPEPGIYNNIPFDEYLTWEAASDSILSKLRSKSPAHARFKQLYPQKDTAAFFTGRLLHCLALEPEKLAERYAIVPDRAKRSKADKEFWAELESNANGKTLLKQADYQAAQSAIDDIKQQIIYRYIQQGEAEVCLVWVDKKTGVLCKCRIDYLNRKYSVLIDLKSTIDASPEGFARAIHKWRYYQKAAFYHDGWKAITDDPSVFVFLALEKVAETVPIDGQGPRHAVAAYEAHDDMISAGRLEYRKALETYTECLKTGVWPAYADTVKMINLSDWALRDSGVNPYEQLEEE